VNRLSRSAPPSSQTSNQDPAYLTVSEVTRLVNDILEMQFPQLLFRGEISQLTLAQSGHIYFTIKDEGAQLACALWAGVARTLTFKPRVGMTVRCHGRPNVYAQSGRFQVVVHRLFEDGEGELRRRFLELQKRLADDGFFAEERKRPLPFLPKAVGIVTSSTGAVIHDMMVKIRERFPSMVVYLADTRVQGEGAASEIARAIKKLDHSGLVDVIIVARGGGSLEDLWAFNEEEVVKAVFACSRPVISGVGHEVDITLCDLAADVRAPTPTAAAEMVVPHVEDLRAHIDELARRLADTDRWYQPRVQRVDELSLRLRSRLGALATEAQLRLKAAESALVRIKPHRVMELLRVKLGTLDVRLTESLRRGIRERALGVDIVAQRLARALSPETLRQQRTVVESLAERLSVTRTRIVDVHRARFESAQARLESVSPQAVLNRGFSIVYSRGAHVRSVVSVSPGDPLDIRVADGVINSIVGSK
jgi:exodeoxyribonuclease VII large subunit